MRMTIPNLPYTFYAALLWITLKWAWKGPELPQIPPKAQASSQNLFLPSPIEVDFLEPKVGLWNKTFTSMSPLTPERVPELYTSALRSGRGPGLSPIDFERARRWSVLLNSLHLKLLPVHLGAVPQGLEKGKRAPSSCSRMESEVAYRWAQLRPELKKNLSAFWSVCGEEGPLLDWNQLELALQQKNKTRAAEVIEKLRARSFKPDKSWAMWFSGELVKIGELSLAQQN